MSIHDRIKLVVKWLIGTGVSNNQESIGRLIGYTNKSSFSQILNNKVPIPEGFIDKLCRLNQNINKVWIETERGSMLNSDQARLSSAVPTTENIPLTGDSIIYKMYKDLLQYANDERERKDAQLREERAAKEALIKENGRLEERLHQLESSLTKESNHPSAIEEVIEAFTEAPSGGSIKDSIHTRKPTTTLGKSLVSKTQ